MAKAREMAPRTPPRILVAWVLKVYGLGFSGLSGQGSGFRVQGFQGSGFRDCCVGSQVPRLLGA